MLESSTMALVKLRTNLIKLEVIYDKPESVFPIELSFSEFASLYENIHTFITLQLSKWFQKQPLWLIQFNIGHGNLNKTENISNNSFK